MRKDFILVVCLILGIAIFLKVSNKNNAIKSPAPTIKEQQSGLKVESSPVATPPNMAPSQFSTQTAATEATPTPQSPTPSGVSHAENTSILAQKSFMQMSRLQVDLPKNFAFRDLDVPSDRMAAIYSQSNGLGMAVVSYQGTVSAEEVKAFIKSKDTGIPNLDTNGIRFGNEPKSFQDVQGSGLSGAKIWSGVAQDGKEVHVAVFSRNDGAGTYMIVISGDSSKIETQSDEFENVYRSMKAEPK